jgi:hypothetical protein
LKLKQNIVLCVNKLTLKTTEMGYASNQSAPCRSIADSDLYYYQKDHKYLLHDFQSDYRILFSKCDELNDINEYQTLR